MRFLMMKRKVKNKMIKGNLLREKIDACGFKLVYVAKQVGVSYQAFLKKLNNETEFKASGSTQSRTLGKCCFKSCLSFAVTVILK